MDKKEFDVTWFWSILKLLWCKNITFVSNEIDVIFWKNIYEMYEIWQFSISLNVEWPTVWIIRPPSASQLLKHLPSIQRRGYDFCLHYFIVHVPELRTFGIMQDTRLFSLSFQPYLTCWEWTPISRASDGHQNHWEIRVLQCGKAQKRRIPSQRWPNIYKQ